MSFITETLVSHETVRRLEKARKELEAAEKAFNDEAFTNLPLKDGKKVEPGAIVELLSGLQYEIRSISFYANRNLRTMGATIQVRRRYKEGRRKGTLANSSSFISYGDIHAVVSP